MAIKDWSRVQNLFDKLPKADFLRLAHQAGANRLSGLMYAEFRSELLILVHDSVQDLKEAGSLPSADGSKLEFRRSVFASVMREACPSRVFTASALDGFQAYCERYFVYVLQKASEETKRANRLTMYPKDFHRAKRRMLAETATS